MIQMNAKSEGEAMREAIKISQSHPGKYVIVTVTFHDNKIDGREVEVSCKEIGARFKAASPTIEDGCLPTRALLVWLMDQDFDGCRFFDPLSDSQCRAILDAYFDEGE